ncbi:MAG: crossover junction endodeoxyribonuclease RuvC [Ferrovum sp.]|nr:crossover junction endodeoxyribonuclease RuvC [Ferrovum sp.]NDU87271.1 crossover junction endodeoxyribonuclease RuvC [Ferrovum sp.]
MRILGVDPGLRCTGFGIIEDVGQGKPLRYVASGAIRTSTTATLPERLKVLFEGLQSVIASHQPQVMAIELVFVNVNPQTTLLLGQARGALIAAAVTCQLAVHEYTALQIKQAVVGHGHAGKDQVQAMVSRLLGLAEVPSTDPADALACAIRHAHGDNVPLAAVRTRTRRWTHVPEMQKRSS